MGPRPQELHVEGHGQGHAVHGEIPGNLEPVLPGLHLVAGEGDGGIGLDLEEVGALQMAVPLLVVRVDAGRLGASPLKPELSTNYTLGATASFGDLDVTLDFYRIDMEDRMNAVSSQPVSTDPTAGAAYDNYLALSGAGVVGAESIAGVQWFTQCLRNPQPGCRPGGYPAGRLG